MLLLRHAGPARRAGRRLCPDPDGCGRNRRPLARLRRLGVPAAIPDGAFLLRGRAAAPGVARRPHARRCAGPHGPCRTRGRLRLGRRRRPCRHGDVLRKPGSLRGLLPHALVGRNRMGRGGRGGGVRLVAAVPHQGSFRHVQPVRASGSRPALSALGSLAALAASAGTFSWAHDGAGRARYAGARHAKTRKEGTWPTSK